MTIKIIKITLFLLLIASCKSKPKADLSKQTKSTNAFVRLIGEQIIPANTKFKNTRVGGLSSIDYANGLYYLISDDKGSPVRVYEMELFFTQEAIVDYTITDLIPIETANSVDPEALRYDITTKHFFWTSEGLKYKKEQPTIFEIDKKGTVLNTLKAPKMLQYDFKSKEKGARSNGTFEGLSMSVDSGFLWAAMELPLKEDGEEPKLKQGVYPIRISKINKKTGILDYQFAYYLESIPRDSNPPNKFKVNGVSEILEIAKNQFLFVERAYAVGHKDGGNTIRIYKVDCSKATDISSMSTLKKATYIEAKKTLLLDFDTIKDQLSQGIIDNIEGITFGPRLENGNRSLVLVSDNNFNKFNKQLNQIIVLELLLAN